MGNNLKVNNSKDHTYQLVRNVCDLKKSNNATLNLRRVSTEELKSRRNTAYKYIV